MDEEQHITPDGLLDWLCWKYATTGERFYPPRETAEMCCDGLYEDGEMDEGLYEYILGKEVGQHGRAWSESVDFFESLQAEGYDPVARVERHIDESDLDLPAIDWKWLEKSRVEVNGDG